MATVTIDVSLDTSADPAVVLSSRNKKAANGDTIRWQKKDNNDKFDITDLQPNGANSVFGAPDKGGSGQWLDSKFNGTGSGNEYEYTLTVTSGKNSYDTTKTTTEPDGGRPVIRN